MTGTDGGGGRANDRDRPLTFYWRAPAWLDRLRLPPARPSRYAKAREAILLEAVIAHYAGCPNVSYSRRREFYAELTRYHGTAFTYATVMSSVNELAKLGLIENHIAMWWPGGTGVQSTFRATPMLLNAVPKEVVSQADYVACELVRLKNSQKRLIDYRDTDRTRQMRRFLVEQNEALGALHIELDAPGVSNDSGILRVGADIALFPAMRSLYRVFNETWGQGGRMYGGWWQQVPKELRPSLLIDRQPVIECDYAQLHPRLLYRLAGQRLVSDAYTLPGWDRKLGKKGFNILLNAESYRSAVGAVADEIGGPDAQAHARTLIEALKAQHAPVGRFFHTGIGLPLQAIDADMAEAVLRPLLGQGITALPIHDSFVVQERHQPQLEEAMNAAFGDVGRFSRFRQLQRRVA